MIKSKWKKAYAGPFKKTKAFELMRDLKNKPDSQIEKVAIRKRGGRDRKHKGDMFDIYIKIKQEI